MKVLFDTNFYVAYAIGGAQPRRILYACSRSRTRIYCSEFIIEEIRRVLFRLRRTPRQILAVIQEVDRVAEIVVPGSSKHRVAADPNDTPVLQAAIRASVDFLVTNDRGLLEKDPCEGIRILSINQFETLLRDQGLIG